MADNPIDIKRTPPLRRWRGTGKDRTLGGRWSKQRVAEELIQFPHRQFSLADLAKLVYGTNGQSTRDSVRKHISGQRVFMMGRLTPFITRYGHRGLIESIKLYVATEPDDRQKMEIELQSMLDRNEMSVERAEKMRQVLNLPPPQLVT